MLFGKKEKDVSLEERLREIEERVKGLSKGEQKNQQTDQTLTHLAAQHQKIEVEKEEENLEEVQVPLFVKLDKYKTIISSLMHLKTLFISLRNSLVALEQIEKTREETFKLIIKNLEKINEKLSILEREVVKPVSFSFGMPSIPYAPIEEMQNIQASIASLKAQIDQLKAELESTG
jgi:DNA repair exonuclease SbcCD ATPase subunit